MNSEQALKRLQELESDDERLALELDLIENTAKPVDPMESTITNPDCRVIDGDH